MQTTSTEMRERIKKIMNDRVPMTNVSVAKFLLVASALCLLMLLLFDLGVLQSKGVFVFVSFVIIPLFFVATAVWCLVRQGEGRAFPYIFTVLLLIFCFELAVMSGYKTNLLLPVVILLSLRYYNKKLTLFAYAGTLLVLIGCNFANAYIYVDTGFLDLNLVSFDTNMPTVLQGFLHNNIISLAPSSKTLLHNGFIISVFPNFIFLTLFTVLGLRFMRYNLANVITVEVLAEKDADQRAELSDMKTKAVLSQVKPHFMYNALSSIAAYCTENPEKAQELTMDFSDYLRNNLDTLDEDTPSLVPFLTEIDHVKSYLNIEKCRFEEKLNVVFNLTFTDFDVPTLIIQPIVENAVKHGVCKKEEGGTVTVSSYETDEGYVVTVTDDGVGFDANALQDDGKVHIGVKNVQKRLGLFGGTFTLESTVGVGTTATICLPKGGKTV